MVIEYWPDLNVYDKHSDYDSIDRITVPDASGTLYDRIRAIPEYQQGTFCPRC